MTQEFKRGDRVKILRPAYAGEEGEFIRCHGSIDTGKGLEKGYEVKLDKDGIQEFSVSELEKLS